MAGSMLLGNDQLKQTLRASIGRGHISHFYLITGPRGSGKRTLAGYLSAAILCQGSEKPCMQCNSCRKVMQGIHPDVIVVDDPDKKTVTVGMAREARADMFIMPNESDHKIYQFPRADDINIAAQNALLKVLEEPPAYGVFLLLAENPNRLLPTIRSRAAELRLNSLPASLLKPWLRERFPNADDAALEAAIARSSGIAGQAYELLNEDSASDPRTDAWTQAFCSQDPEAMLQVMVPLEKASRQDLAELLEQWLMLTGEALAGLSGGSAVSGNARKLCAALDRQRLYDAAMLLRKMQEYLAGNVSVAAICCCLGKGLVP